MNKTGFKNKENKSQSAHSYDSLVLMVSFLPFLGAGERRKERTKTLGTRLIAIIVAVIFDDSRINKNHASCHAVYVCSNRKYKYFAISEEKNTAPLKLFRKRSQPQMGLRSLAKTFHWSLSV